MTTSTDMVSNQAKKKQKKISYKKRTVLSGGPKQPSGSAKNQANLRSQKPGDPVKSKQPKNNICTFPLHEEGVFSADEAEESQDLSLSTATLKLDKNELSIKLKSDLVRTVAEKVDLIYNKFNSLLMQQERIIEESGGGEEKARALNEQRANFSAEMVGELEKNIDFGEFGDVSSNPELIKQLQQVYLQLKQNGVGVQKKEGKASVAEVVEIKKCKSLYFQET